MASLDMARIFLSPSWTSFLYASVGKKKSSYALVKRKKLLLLCASYTILKIQEKNIYSVVGMLVNNRYD